MTVPPIRTVRDARSSLFQSAVAAYARSQHPAAVPTNALAGINAIAALKPPAGPDAFTHALGSPLVVAASAAVRAAPRDTNAAAGEASLAIQAPHPLGDATSPAPDNVNAAVLAKALGEAMAAGNESEATRLKEEMRKFSAADRSGWVGSALTYAGYISGWKQAIYRDWTREGNGDRNYSVIEWKLPDNARVGILGDWGTNMDDARAVLTVMNEKKIDAVIHLGDIYYSGTEDECMQSLRIFRDVLGPGIPVFCIPGNHEYFSGGHGFYKMLDGLNSGIPGAAQPASYFCLRTHDGAWQFLGMDTGQNEHFFSSDLAPATFLTSSEADWHRDKLDTFEGKTILLSHHQLFSAHETLRFNERRWLNDHLLGVFQPYFQSRIAAWLWGHEHNLVLYADNVAGLRKGRLIGASAYEETTSEGPYDATYREVPYLDATGYRLDAAEGYYNHSYAIIDFGVRKAPQDPVSITYYQYPSWSGVRKPYPPPPANEKIYTEDLNV